MMTSARGAALHGARRRQHPRAIRRSYAGPRAAEHERRRLRPRRRPGRRQGLLLLRARPQRADLRRSDGRLHRRHRLLLDPLPASRPAVRPRSTRALLTRADSTTWSPRAPPATTQTIGVASRRRPITAPGRCSATPTRTTSRRRSTRRSAPSSGTRAIETCTSPWRTAGFPGCLTEESAVFKSSPGDERDAGPLVSDATAQRLLLTSFTPTRPSRSTYGCLSGGTATWAASTGGKSGPLKTSPTRSRDPPQRSRGKNSREV